MYIIIFIISKAIKKDRTFVLIFGGYMKTISDRDFLELQLKNKGLDEIFTERAKKGLFIRKFSTGATVSYEGLQVKTLSIVLSGRLRVVASSLDGNHAVVDYINEGDLLGDIEYFQADENIHAVIAKSAAVVLEVPYEIIDQELKHHAPFLFFLSKKLAIKLKASSLAHSKHLLYSTKVQLCKFLVEMADIENSDVLQVKNVELAQRLGSTDRHIRRLVGELCDENLLEKVGRGQLRILSREELRKKVK